MDEKNETNGDGIIAKLRKPKVLKMAIFDWLATFIAALILMVLTGQEMTGKKWAANSFWLVVLGEFLHIALGVKTPMANVITNFGSGLYH